MEKEFIPYEIALKLKKLGFDEPCAACYGSYTHKTSELFLNINNPVNIETLVREKTGFNRPTFYVKSPTFSQAFRWFREKYGIIGNVNDNCILENTYSISISKIFDSRILYVNGRNHNLKDKQGFTTYEEAELECLKKLIEIVTNKKLENGSLDRRLLLKAI